MLRVCFQILLAIVASLATGFAQSPLRTTLVGGTVLPGYAGASTQYFDLTVNAVGAPAGLIVTQFHLRTQAATPAGAVDVYRTAVGGTHVGNHASAGAWTKIGTGAVVDANPTVLLLDAGFYLAPGQYGFALHYRDVQAVYTIGASQMPPLPNVFATAELTVDCTASTTQNSTVLAPFGGAESVAPRTPNLAIFYQMTSYAHFTATPTRGAGPLAVQFTDGSVSMDQPSNGLGTGAGFVAWFWDSDGDTVDDLFTQNPARFYGCGDWSVRLTVVDAFGAVSRTRADLLTVDPLTADFTWTLVGNPATLAFTPRGAPSATSWQWDLDGVPGVDATVPNPTFAYAPGCAPIDVTLAVANSCRAATRTIRIAPTPSLPTQFTANNQGAAGSGNYFDVAVAAVDGIAVCGLHVNCNDPVGGTPITVDVYTRPGTYVGNDLSAAGWTRVTGVGIAAPRDTETYVPLPSTIYLRAGVHGMAVFVNGVGPAYMGQGSSPLPGATSYGNGDLTLSLGIARSAPFAGTLFSPRIWSGRLDYRTVAQGMPGYYVFGAGCSGSLGVVGNSAVALPVAGQAMTVRFAGAPFGVLPFYGFSNTLFAGFPLPIDAGVLGAPGCPMRISPDLAGPILLAPSPLWTEPVPAQPNLLGMRFYTQAFSFELPGFNGLAGSLSDAAVAILGS